MADIVDGIEVVWAFRPDDPKKQGKTETLPADVARMKVSEGLARLAPAKPAPAPEPDADEADAPAKAAAKKSVPEQGKGPAGS